MGRQFLNIFCALLLAGSVAQADEVTPEVSQVALTNWIEQIDHAAATADDVAVRPEVLAAAAVGVFYLWRGRNRRWVI